MRKIVIKDKEIIKKILQNKSNCNEMTIYIMGNDAKLAIIDTDTLDFMLKLVTLSIFVISDASDGNLLITSFLLSAFF